jgi:pSer/pThr/pTyr-binding forkhead associated (FHA) protein
MQGRTRISVPDEQVIPMPLPVRRPEHRPTVTALTPVVVPEQPRQPSASIGFPLLEVSRGPQAGTVFSVPPGGTTVGRDRDCDFTLDDPTVSRQHAEFQRFGLDVAVRDSGSLNGTYINGRPCDRTTALVDGDEVWIGKFRLVFRDRRK